ncbi:MAG TPA: lysophospholipid acyltransferase family protein [Verrucomicrobiae bacterium]|nr:lysophospholipid acyltransferase family protein [Verrucomicrobiae bacterium]
MKYYWLKSAELLARVLPRRMNYGIARRVADLYVLFDKRGRESVIANLQQIHASSGMILSPRALHSLARENFLNFAKYLVDFFKFLRLDRRQIDKIVHFGNVPKALDDLLAHGKGVIFLSAHLGNWELGAAALAALGYKLNSVALQVPDKKLNELYQHYRALRGLYPIPFGRAGRECIAAIRRNEIVGVVADRDFTGSNHTVEFFGRPARLPDGPAKLALATGAPLLPIFMVRLPDDTFAYIMEEPIWADKSRQSVDDIMRLIAAALERVIRQHSEQWFLFHNLWDIESDRALAAATAFGATTPKDAADSDADQAAASD